MARGDQLARQWSILQKLQACKYGKSVQELAYYFECTPRTIYRDLDALQCGGFPIYKDRIYGKYVWRLICSAQKNSYIPISHQEIESLLYCFQKRQFNAWSPEIKKAIISLLKKIECLLPETPAEVIGGRRKLHYKQNLFNCQDETSNEMCSRAP